MRIVVILSLCAALALQTALGAPWPALKLEKIEGTLVAYTWIGGFHFHEEDVWPVVNNLGVREMVPHYYLLLNKTNLSEKQRNDLTQYARNANFSPKICGRPLEDDEVLVLVDRKRIKDFKTGSKIELTNYEIQADEFTSWTTHQGFMVDGVKPTEGRQDSDDPSPASGEDKPEAKQDGTGQPATRFESDTEASDKPKPEANGCPR